MWFRRKKIDDQEWEALNREVVQLTRDNSMDQALAAAEKLFGLSRKAFGRRHKHTVTALNNLGIIHTLRREFDEAESCLLAALQMSEKVSGEISQEVAVVNMNLAKLYMAKVRMINEMCAPGAEGES